MSALDTGARADDYFGLCPRCRQDVPYANIGRNHFKICHEHRVFWRIGSNLFSGWRDETEADWRKTEELIAGYTEVEPFFWPKESKVSSQHKPEHNVIPFPPKTFDPTGLVEWFNWLLDDQKVDERALMDKIEACGIPRITDTLAEILAKRKRA